MINKKIKNALEPYGFISIAVVLLALLMLVPIITVIYRSLFSNYIVTPDSTWVGTEHYLSILKDSVFIESLMNTIVFTIASVILHLVVGLSFALLLNYPLPLGTKTFFRVMLIFPWAFTSAIVAVNWRLLLDPMGIINYLLKSAGLIENTIPWFGSTQFAMIALIIVNVWRGYPFIMVSLLAGLQGISITLYEAGKIDGANIFQRFIYITLPQLKPILLSIGLLDSIWTFRLFPLIYLTTGGGPGHSTETLSTYTYKMAFNSFEFSKASALAVIVLLVTSALSIYYVRKQKIND